MADEGQGGGGKNMEDNERYTVLRYACRIKGIGRRVESIWQKQFLTDA